MSRVLQSSSSGEVEDEIVLKEEQINVGVCLEELGIKKSYVEEDNRRVWSVASGSKPGKEVRTTTDFFEMGEGGCDMTFLFI